LTACLIDGLVAERSRAQQLDDRLTPRMDGLAA
jgi:hypothetical protein